ncbi:MAG: tyrosine--tRNA ligase [Candidatus Omnitrophica bacterium]|nr:tyrosine--tRNA ligase [Candidatus Omnitrophota bacterium]
MDTSKSLETIKRGAVEIIDEAELTQRLELSRKEKRPLVVKAGFDPTARDIHLGHTVLLRKMRHFQDLGHKVVLLIGDYTAMIGDPSGRSEIRKRISREQAEENAATYTNQASKIIDMDKCQIAFNSKWFGAMSLTDFMSLAALQTVARVLERDDFSKRYKAGKEISLLEFIYPLLQGYDSVVLKSDVELGGTDQKFNLLMGKVLQRRFNMPQQVVLTMPLLEGTDGVQKMSKSLGNYIGITDEPSQMFGKIMSISDTLMWRYYELLTDTGIDEIKAMKCDTESGKMHPKQAKIRLAKDIIAQYHNSRLAESAAVEFEKIFVKKDIPDDVLVYKVDKGGLEDGRIWICALLTKSDLTKSNTQARSMIKQGAVLVNQKKISDENMKIIPEDGMVIQVGKRRFIRLSLR